MTVPTNLPLLSGSRIKIERAKRHIHEPTAEFTTFVESKPYALLPEHNPRTRLHDFRLKYRRQQIPTPAAWGGILGDIIDNLRCAYDLLACDLVRANGEQL